MPRRKMTDEERDAKKAEKARVEGLQSRLNRIRDDRNLPESTRFFKVGQQVRIGNLDYTEIAEVLDDGKIYLVNITNVKTLYGSKKVTTEYQGYWPWFEIFPYQEVTSWRDDPHCIENEDIRINYQSRDVEGLLGTYYAFGIDLTPEYQRGNVWTNEQEVALIDSIFKNVDIGKFTIIRLPYKSNSDLNEMLDGKQRLTALMRFFEDRFTYQGKVFSEMTLRERGHFKRYHIKYGEIQNLTEEQKLRFFLHLNTSGTPMDPEHLARVEMMWERVVKTVEED